MTTSLLLQSTTTTKSFSRHKGQNRPSSWDPHLQPFFGGLAYYYQGKKEDIVFRFIIIEEYSSLRDGFWSLSNRSLFLYEDFWKMMIFWLVLKLEISYHRVLTSWMILISFREFFEDYIFAWWKYLSFNNSSFALRYFSM